MAVDGSRRPTAAAPPDRDTGMFARNSVSVVGWTTVSRLSGFVRIAVVAAVLGPTYLGNVFQATNSLPMIAYAALTGSLFSSLLVPSLVRHVDSGDRAAGARLAGAFLTAALAAFGVVCALLAVAAPLILRLLAVGVPDPAAAAAQRRVGLVLLLLFVPQMLMYAVVGTAEAVMHAHGRFALPAAAPVLENVGIIATMVVTAVVYGTGDRLAEATTGQLLLLGIGTTSAVALHAAVQWWGARSVGVTLRPRVPWRVPELRSILRRAVQALGFSVLDVVQPMGALIVANRVPGGVIAFQLAFSLYGLPSALGTRPVAVALLPRLARLARLPDLRRFRDELVRGARLVAFLIVPAAVAYLALPDPIAGAVTFGQMAAPPGRALVAACVLGLAPGLLGYAALLLGTQACYARRDARSPLHAALLRTAVAAAGMVVALRVPSGAGALLALGLTISAADIAGGTHLVARLRGALPAASDHGLLRPLLRTLAASVLMVGPAYLVGVRLPGLLPGPFDPHLSMVAAAAVGGTIYLLLQRWWGSPELTLIRTGLRPGGAPAPAPGGDDAVVIPADRADDGADRADDGADRADRADDGADRAGRAERADGAGRAGRRTVLVVVLAGVAAVALAPAAAALPLNLVAAGLGALVLIAVAYAHPPAAAYLVLVATPLTAGFPRGMVVPMLRPHEALALVVGAGVLLRTVVRPGSTRRLSGWPGPIDGAFVLLACASSVLPLLWLAARGMTPTLEDLLYASAIWKFYALYLLIRGCVRTEREVRRCLYVSLAAAGVVAVVAILQSLNLAGVPDLLLRLVPPEDATGLAAGRGSATLGSSISVGDVMAFHVAICLALLLRTRVPRRVLLPCTALFAIGTLASGQVSAVIAVGICVVTVAVVTGQVKRLLAGAVPAAALAAVLLWPVIAQRLAQRDVTGVPQSWYVRYENLRRYVWPDLFSGENWLFGVRPDARIEVATPWGSAIYIESGHTWLLWTGGIPFLIAYLWFMVVAIRTTASIASRRQDAVGVAAIASLASLTAVFFLMSFDPHITMRGAADLTYTLLALATAVPTRAAASQPVRGVAVVRTGTTS